MKKVIFLSLLTLTLAVPALAQNATDGVSAEVACGAGSCFVPRFTFLGEVVKYVSGATANGLTMEAGDCCIGPDTYQIKLSRAGLSGGATTNDIVSGACTTAWAGGSAVRLMSDSPAVSGAKGQIKAKKVPGGFPAAGYVRFSSGAWVRTLGGDDCGF